MAYVAPTTKTAGQKITAAIWNQDVKDNILYLASLLGIESAVANQGTITTVTDLTNLSATVTVPASRRVKLTFCGLTERTVADGATRYSIKEGTTVLQLIDCKPATAAVTETVTGFVVLAAPSAGAHTYKVTLERLSGTGSVQSTAASTYPAQLMVEDVGAA